MEQYTVLHQLEVRFPTILDFPLGVRPLLSPFQKLCSSLHIYNENKISERINLLFEDEFYQISLFHNNLVLRSQNNLETHIQNNSSLSSVFFDLLKVLESHPTFNGQKNFLHYALFVELKDTGSDFSVDRIGNAVLKKEVVDLIDSKYDISCTISGFEDDIESNIDLTIGAYIGSKDLERRKIEIIREDHFHLIEASGRLFETRIHNLSDDFTFAKYKKIGKHIISKEISYGRKYIDERRSTQIR